MTINTLDNQEGTRKLHIESAGGGFVTLKLEFAGREEYFTVSSDSIPSISLALLEAAGVDGACLAEVEDIMNIHIEEQERITAEAKDQANRPFEDVFEELYRVILKLHTMPTQLAYDMLGFIPERNIL